MVKQILHPDPQWTSTTAFKNLNKHPTNVLSIGW